MPAPRPSLLAPPLKLLLPAVPNSRRRARFQHPCGLACPSSNIAATFKVRAAKSVLSCPGHALAAAPSSVDQCQHGTLATGGLL